MPSSNECLSYSDFASEVAAGNFEWLGAAQSGSQVATRTWFNTYVRNTGGLAGSSQLITYATALTYRAFSSPTPSKVHSLSLSFPGSAQSASISAGPGNEGGGKYSIEGWIKRTASGVTQTIFSQLTNAGDGYIFGIGTDNQFKLWLISGNTVVGTLNFGITSTGSWEHVSVQVNVSASSSSHTLVHNATTSANVTATISTIGSLLEIAHEPDVPDLDDFVGLFDDLRIYTVARAASTIATDYQSATPGANCAYRFLLESYTGSGTLTFAADTGSSNFVVSGASTSTDTPF